MNIFILFKIIISSAYISSPVFLNFDFITNSHNSAIQSITNIPHIKNVISTSSKSNIKQLLDLYVQEIKVRKAKLVNAKVADQKSFNNVLIYYIYMKYDYFLEHKYDIVQNMVNRVK